jgi:hypothetical protein
MDPTSITAILGSIKTAADIAKLIKDSDVSLEKAETKLKLADLISALADAKLEVVGIQQTLAETEATVRQLEDKLRIRRNIRWKEPAYWVEEDDSSDGPFCQKCYDIDSRLVRLQGDGEGWFQCLACTSSVVTKEYRARAAAAVRSHNSRSLDDY